MSKELITWHDVSFGLWAFILACGVFILKFLSWFSTGEIAIFWEKINTMQQAQIEILKKEIDCKFSELDCKIQKIHLATHGKKEEKDAVLLQVLEQLNKISEHQESKRPF